MSSLSSIDEKIDQIEAGIVLVDHKIKTLHEKLDKIEALSIKFDKDLAELVFQFRYSPDNTPVMNMLKAHFMFLAGIANGSNQHHRDANLIKRL